MSADNILASLAINPGGTITGLSPEEAACLTEAGFIRSAGGNSFALTPAGSRKLAEFSLARGPIRAVPGNALTGSRR